MPDDPTTPDEQAEGSASSDSPTAAELAGTIFANVHDYSNDSGGGELITDAAIGGGDG
jgi:hypothetical protein